MGVDVETAVPTSSVERSEDGAEGCDEDDETTSRVAAVEESSKEGEEGLARPNGAAEKVIGSSVDDLDSSFELVLVELR